MNQDALIASEPPVLECRSLSKAFGKLWAVRDVSLSLLPGQIVGLIGPNGAGKTTLMRMLSTLLPPTEGDIRLFGLDSKTVTQTARRHIGFLPDFFNLYRNLTLTECLQFFAHVYGVPEAQIPARIDDALTAADLLEKRHAFIRHLSRGMVQRLGMAVMITRDAKVMILDEPASGLDPNARVQLRALLKTLAQQDKTILISSHVLNELGEACSHIAVMDRGKIVVQGTLDAIKRRIFSGLRFRIRSLDDRTAVLRAALDAGATGGQIADDAVVIDVPDEAQVAVINARLTAQGIRVTELREISDLESVFVQITARGEVSHGNN